MVDASRYFLTPDQVKAGWRIEERPADDVLVLRRYEMQVAWFTVYAQREAVQAAIAGKSVN